MNYMAPKTLKEAERLKKNIKKSRYLAGGTTLNWRSAPKNSPLIDLKNLPLYGIKKKGSSIEIGTLTPLSNLKSSSVIPYPLKKAVDMFDSLNVRNMATVGGSAAGPFFISNILPVLIAYKASAVYYSNSRRHTVLLENWLKEKKGILCSVLITRPGRSIYLTHDKISAIDFPSVVTAVGFELKAGKLTEAVLVVSGLSSKFQVLNEASNYLSSVPVKKVDFDKLNSLVQKNISPTGNVKVSARVKRKFIEKHIKEIVENIAGEKS